MIGQVLYQLADYRIGENGDHTVRYILTLKRYSFKQHKIVYNVPGKLLKQRVILFGMARVFNGIVSSKVAIKRVYRVIADIVKELQIDNFFTDLIYSGNVIQYKRREIHRRGKTFDTSVKIKICRSVCKTDIIHLFNAHVLCYCSQVQLFADVFLAVTDSGVFYGFKPCQKDFFLFAVGQNVGFVYQPYIFIYDPSVSGVVSAFSFSSRQSVGEVLTLFRHLFI